MQVLHIVPYMHPAAGGPPVVVKRLADLAPANGWSARVLTTSDFCEDDGRTLEAELRRDINATVLPIDRPRLLGLSASARKAVDDSVRASDIVHVHTVWHPFNTAARRACARHGRKYVLAPHGMLDPYSLGVKAVRKRLYLTLREGRNLRDAARLIFTTPLEEQLAKASLPWLNGGDVIPLGADAPPSGVSRDELASIFVDRFPATRGRRNLIFLGRLHPKKGLERILAALPSIAAEFPQILLIVAGSGDPAYMSSLQEADRQLGAASHVLFTGLLQGREKWGALAAAEAFLLPSHQENFAIAAAEAMHMGLPLILSDKVNIWPFVTEAKAGIVLKEPEIERELQNAAMTLLKAPEAARAMGARGESFAKENFTWAASARLTHQLYERLLGASPGDSRLPGRDGLHVA